MTEHLTAGRLKEIKARCEAATPGPWNIAPCTADAFTIEGPEGENLCELANYPPFWDRGPQEANAMFIAHARTDIPVLVAEIERQRMELAEDDYLDAEATIGAKEMIAENGRLRLELAQAKAAAVQWITYDGSPETLPVNGRKVLLYRPRHPECWPEIQCVSPDKSGKSHYWIMGGIYDIHSGDCWSYLPEPPEVK